MLNNLLTRKRSGFTLVELMIVIAILALLAGIAVPGFFRARKRSQATRMLQDLRLLTDAVDQYAVDNSKSSGQSFGWPDLQTYIKTGSQLCSRFAPDGSAVYDIFGNPYCTDGIIDANPTSGQSGGNIQLNLATYNSLSDVAPIDFWTPFGVQP